MLPFLVAAVLVSAVAAWTDWKTGEMPNWLTLGPLAVAPFAHMAHGYVVFRDLSAAAAEGGYSLLGAVVCAAVPVLLYRQDAIGGGDVKLFLALGALCHPLIGIEAEMYGFFTAALIAPARLAYEGKLARTLKGSFYLLVNPFLPKAKKMAVEQEMTTWFRMGPAIFVGMVVTAVLHRKAW